MKDHSQNSEFETEIGVEKGVEKGAEITAELEARIAALVLGEASDLEADQLQRLIDTRPELAARKAQFEAVHGLLREIGAGEDAVQGDPWKLPTEMRNRLLAVIDGQSQRQIEISPVINPVVATSAIKPRVRWKHSRLVALLCVAGCLGMFALSGTFMLQSKTAQRETALALNRRFRVAADDSPVKGYALPQLRDGTEFSADTKILDFGLSDAPVATSPLSAIRESLGTDTAAPNAYYLNDDVQNFRNVVPAEPAIDEVAAIAKSGATSASPAGPSSSDLKNAVSIPYEGKEEASSKFNGSANNQWSIQDGEQPNADTRFRYLADPEAALAEGKDSDMDGIIKHRISGGMGGEGMANSASVTNGKGGYGGDAAAEERRLSFAKKFRSQFGTGGEPRVRPSGNTDWSDHGGPGETFAGRVSGELSQQKAGVEYDFDAAITSSPERAVQSAEVMANQSLVREAFESREQGFIDTSRDLRELDEVAANNSTADSQLGDVRLPVEKGIPLLAGKPLELFGTEKEKDAVALGLELKPAPVAEQSEQRQSTEDQLALGKVRRGESLGKLSELEAKAKNRLEGRAVDPANLNETLAAAESFSTFSLHISDVSFQLAQAALAGGKWPEANQVRIEEFVNAFDYGDPLPSQYEKVACIVEQAIHPTLQQRNVMRVSLRTAATGRASHTPLRLTLVLDNSGSMERSDRQQMVRRAFALLAQQLTAQDQVTLISFARMPRLLADKVSGDKSPQLLELIQNLPSEGGTNIEAALQLAFEKAREQQAGGAQSRIVLLTDGAVNLGDANPNSLSQMITTIRDSGIAFDAAGISAEGLNDEILEALARQGDGRYYLLDSNEAADDGFARQIAGALRPSAKNVKVQIEFNPRRVGRYKLLGFEKHLLKQEDFRNDQVDAAELAAAEAGVAVYQFEAKPDGEGDVGSVSVRFQDLATGQMVENRWPIPYQADAPQVTQAAPALRIASTAAMLASKLRGDALAETIELKSLAELMAGLPASVRQANRVEQLQQMIEQARQLIGN